MKTKKSLNLKSKVIGYTRSLLKFTSTFGLIALGAFLIAFASLRYFVNTPSQRPLQTVNVSLEAEKGKPSRLYIPKISKTLDVLDGQIIDNRWSIADRGVSYLTSSAMPGTRGNSVLYGHNTRDILGSLPAVGNGDAIYVVMDNADIYKYEVSETKEVKPNQVEILNQTEDSTLTIYTCSGFLDTARFVVVSKLRIG